MFTRNARIHRNLSTIVYIEYIFTSISRIFNNKIKIVKIKHPIISCKFSEPYHKLNIILYSFNNVYEKFSYT